MSFHLISQNDLNFETQRCFSSILMTHSSLKLFKNIRNTLKIHKKMIKLQEIYGLQKIQHSVDMKRIKVNVIVLLLQIIVKL